MSHTKESETLCNIGNIKQQNHENSTSKTLFIDEKTEPQSTNLKSGYDKKLLNFNNTIAPLSQQKSGKLISKKLCNENSRDLSSTDTLCIDESLSETVVTYTDQTTDRASSLDQTREQTTEGQRSSTIMDSGTMTDKSGENKSSTKTSSPESSFTDTTNKFTDTPTDFDEQSYNSNLSNLDNTASSGSFGHKIQFGKRPKSILFDKLKNRYERNSSAKESEKWDENIKPQNKTKSYTNNPD